MVTGGGCLISILFICAFILSIILYLI
jgi:hypothetical protein